MYPQHTPHIVPSTCQALFAAHIPPSARSRRHSITYNAFLAYTPSTKPQRHPSPSRTTTMHVAATSRLQIVLHLDRTLSHPSASRPLCSPGNARWSAPLHTEFGNTARYTLRSTNPWQPGGGAARYLLCLSDSAYSTPGVSPFFHFCLGLSLHPRPAAARPALRQDTSPRSSPTSRESRPSAASSMSSGWVGDTGVDPLPLRASRSPGSRPCDRAVVSLPAPIPMALT
ncbi:hypothetical protein B0H13DRAFT_2478546 [Mycena leptocephala]|nr:hypothetical protein B0H13DRAFT_2478546 [Mycena leptocephala]